MKIPENSDFGRMLSYCDALSKNNERPWFHANHKWYDDAKTDYEELLELMRFWVSDAAPALSADIMYMRAKDWMYRIPRDARVKNGKPPYEPSFRAYISADRRSWQPIGYFLRIAHGDSCLGTGLWCWETSQMNIVRDYILENADELEDILEENDLTIVGDSLKTMPKGYAPGCDGAEYIKFKNWSVIFSIPDEKLTTFDEFGGLVRELIEHMEPLRQFLLRASNSGRTRRQELEDFYN